MEKLSTIERMHAREHEKPAIYSAARERAERWDAEAPQRHFEATARALPDELFKDHPEVIVATEMANAARSRHSRLHRLGKQEPAALVLHLQDEVLKASQAIRLAALDDALDGDVAFPKAMAAMERLEILGRRLEAAEMVRIVASSMPMGSGEFADLANARENVLRALLISLKREYLQAHPELLGSTGA